ncbi:hypothetical protein NDU88_003158 [Pleurodeles waltl]|uniref:DDE Tnp4 domain-containing protein n=1 Tax=Pleurodeles waltl TaxID=8319 RepID=A0AAV7VEN1_PLEWA|nr:hypothetical protein NDU88_003158 [Pleurodeles waltl]
MAAMSAVVPLAQDAGGGLTERADGSSVLSGGAGGGLTERAAGGGVLSGGAGGGLTERAAGGGVEDLPTVKGDFYALGHIPNIIGAIDGTHVALVPPQE